MSNTKIVLNRQSDLILDNAQITAPVGIVKADIPENVKLRFDYDPSIPDLFADRDNLIQIVFNINYLVI